MVISRTPLRISFVGGGSDLTSFACEHGGVVVSTAIDKYVYVVVTERFEDEIRVSYTQTEVVSSVEDLQHDLIREALKVAGIRRRIEVVTVADVPARGTGLGSSSAVTVGALNALFAYQGILKSAEELAEEAARIEIDRLGRPIGKQDQYACAFGGFQLLRFGPGDSVTRSPVIMPPGELRELERRLLMFHTGERGAAERVLTGIESALGEVSVTATLAEMRDLALRLYDDLGHGRGLDTFGDRLRENWRRKSGLSPQVAPPAVVEAYRLALDNGAVGGKLLGAGGGGFLLVYVPRERQDAVRSVLRDLRELPVRFEPSGSSIIYVGR